ncbi:uncharacterized protein CG7065-like isoform X1 [Diprion similis]|uniref:uncharacterized protein CG7065-like isoform X1 n=2 Tax=Diprion similis TaxID=362088 RepID=UPI001EF92766|nr:uncharacterized protein CG7065-like isoform X1 [Diprion similis]
MEGYSAFGSTMPNFDDLDIEGRNPSRLSEADREKEELDHKRLMRSSVTAEDGTRRPVYSHTDDGDIWCHICNIALFGAHKLISHNSCNRHKIKLDEWPYPVLLWSKRSDIVKKSAPAPTEAIGDALAPGEPVPPGMEDQMTRTTTIQVSLDRHRSSPLVGLEYLLELIDNDSCEPSYTCVLCDKRGDPRTVMAHITSYNHRITYLNRHFPTISRAITELPRTPNYKRGANEISVLVAKKIEERFGRLQPQLVDKNQFEKNKMQYIKRVYQDYHFRETPELTFMEVYDVRWVTNFDEKMAEIGGGSKKESSLPEEKIEDKHKKDEKKTDKSPPKKVESKTDTTKSGFKIRIVAKDKMSLRNVEKNEDDSKKTPAVRPSDDTKSLSSVSSISSSPSPSRSRSRTPPRGRKLSSLDKSSRYRYRKHSRERSRSHSLEPTKERDKWDKYRDQIRRAEEALDRALKFHEKNPEKHPAYPDEWKKFWNRRYKELQAEGKDPSKHDFKPEWIEFWNKRMREMHNEQLKQRKEEIRKRLELPEDKPPEKWTSSTKRERSPAPKRRHRVDSDDDVEYVGTRTLKTEYHERHDSRDREYAYAYPRGRGSYRGYYPRVATRPRYYATPYPVKDKSPSPIAKEDPLSEDLEIVGLLRLLTALEGQLGSLGPKVVSLLSKALAAEKARPNSAEELLFDEDVNVLFETVKEKLKGQLFAGMIEKMAISATKSAIQNIAQLLHKAAETKRKRDEDAKKRKMLELLEPKPPTYVSRTILPRPVEVTPVKSEPVSVPGVGSVDKVAIAQQIAAALIAQGRTNVSHDELETLINAVVGMAEASKQCNKPVTAADFVKSLAQQSDPPKPAGPEAQAARMESLSDSDLKTLLQNFKDLSTDEQHGLINFLKKLEATDPARVEKLRGFVNLGTPAAPSPVRKPVKSPTPEPEQPITRPGKSSSPFSTRKGIQNPTDDEDNWKPKLDMFAEDDEEMEKKKIAEKAKEKLDLSDDDDDYTFEDIYKAADKNVNENEKAKKKSRSYSRSRSNSPGSWSRSRSRSPRTKPAEVPKSNDPNTILNETKRLIANIMGELPNKYVPKSHLQSPSSAKEDREALSRDPKSTMELGPPGTSSMSLSNPYEQNYNPNQSNQRSLQEPQAQQPYSNMQNQFQAYPPQQTYNNNPGYNINNGYNYNPGYGNIGNQNAYGTPQIAQNQYPQIPQQGYPAYGGPPPLSGYPQQQQQQQQYGNYPPQQRFY